MDGSTYASDPDSPTSMTPTAGLPLPPTTDSDDSDPSNEHANFERLKQLGLSIYKGVWDEFYDWEPGYCADIIATAAQSRPVPVSRRQMTRVAEAMVARLLEEHEHVVPPAQRTTRGTGIVVMSVTHVQDAVSGGQRPVRTRTTNVQIPVITTDAFPPHPKYESCPPVSKSVLVDETRDKILSFIPYADDERFPAQAHQAKFEKLEWEVPFDPDVEMIQMETLKRLHTMHDVGMNDIDRMGIFQKKYRLDHNEGLEWEQSQRDVLHWPGAINLKDNEDSEKVQLPHHTPDPDDLCQRLMSNLKVFCPSINCLQPACQTHQVLESKFRPSTYIPSGKPHKTAKYMVLSEGDPCGPDCFRHIQDFDKLIETLPPCPDRSSPSFLDTLETILGIAPDLFPCPLATICLKPCKEVFIQRLQLFPDDTILPSDSELFPEATKGGKHKKKNQKLKFVDGSHLSCELLGPCAHPGPCTSNDCGCYEKKRHCSPMCRCGVKCNRQWQGCKCTHARCGSAACECVKREKECVPGICIECDAGGKKKSLYKIYGDNWYLGHNGRPCHNTKMQRLAMKPVEVKCGSYGWGAFACQNMDSNAFLGTYVGHILTNTQAEHMGDILKHTSLNYLFEVTPEEDNVHLAIFDATYVGNATRFLNHSEGKKANVEARSKLVNSEHQIGFFTKKKIRAGEELFLDYGTHYWKNT